MAVTCKKCIKRTSQGFVSAVLLCFCLSLAEIIKVINNPVLAALGDNATLNISVKRTVGACTWYRGAVENANIILQVKNGILFEGPKYTHRESILRDYSLSIANVTFSDSGKFGVTIFILPTSDHSTSFIALKVLERISKVVVNISKNEVVEHNDSVVLKCSFFPGTEATVQWIKDSKAIQIQSSQAIQNTSNVIKIHNISRQLAGNYICNVSNGISYKNSNSQQLNVYYGPDTPDITTNVKQPVPVGSDVSLVCTAASNPLPQYRWFLNDTLKHTMQQYVINNITKAQEGMYTCQISNNKTGRTSSGSINITVTARGPHSLSAGAIAGIVIGSIAAVVMITGVIYYIVTKTGVKRERGNSDLNEMNSTETHKNDGRKGKNNQSFEGELQYSSPVLKPSNPADTTKESTDDEAIYSLVNAPITSSSEDLQAVYYN